VLLPLVQCSNQEGSRRNFVQVMVSSYGGFDDHEYTPHIQFMGDLEKKCVCLDLQCSSAGRQPYLVFKFGSMTFYGNNLHFCCRHSS
jgi:hypothetical protein